MITAALVLMLAHSFLRASVTISYILIFYPFWIWQFAQGVSRIFRNTLTLDRLDWIIIAAAFFSMAFQCREPYSAIFCGGAYCANGSRLAAG